MKLSQLIKELQDNVFEGNDPNVLIENDIKLYPIQFTGDFRGAIIIYTKKESIDLKEQL